LGAGRHAALLRGINVGKAKRVAMADLRALVEGLGYKDVRTLLNSGNVVFTVPPGAKGDPATRIEQAIMKALDLTSRVTVLSAAEVAAIVKKNPLATVADNPSRLLITVLTDPADAAKLKPFTKRRWDPEAFALGTRVTYVWCPDGMMESPLSTAVGKLIADGGTTRNLATMTKLHALMNETD
jgi:uncharacterized protein (DUF1697 family)